MSHNAVMFPVISALLGAEEILGKGRDWVSTNDTQERFLHELFGVFSGDVRDTKEIETKVTWLADELNQFLKEKGFSIQLEKFAAGEFGVASVLDLLMEWSEPGERVSLKRYSQTIDNDHPAVRFGKQVADTLIDPGATFGNHEVLVLKTKSGDTVYVTVVKNPPRGLDLVTAVQKINAVTL